MLRTLTQHTPTHKPHKPFRRSRGGNTFMIMHMQGTLAQMVHPRKDTEGETWTWSRLCKAPNRQTRRCSRPLLPRTEYPTLSWRARTWWRSSRRCCRRGQPGGRPGWQRGPAGKDGRHRQGSKRSQRIDIQQLSSSDSHMLWRELYMGSRGWC
jgi:hypothetical protein